MITMIILARIIVFTTYYFSPIAEAAVCEPNEETSKEDEQSRKEDDSKKDDANEVADKLEGLSVEDGQKGGSGDTKVSENNSPDSDNQAER